MKSTTKLVYRYKRVKNSINDFIAPEFAKYGINTNQQDIPYISKRGGGIDHKVLKKYFQSKLKHKIYKEYFVIRKKSFFAKIKKYNHIL